MGAQANGRLAQWTNCLAGGFFGFTVDDVDVEIVGSRLFVAVFFSGVPSNPTRLPHFQLAVPLFFGPRAVVCSGT